MGGGGDGLVEALVGIRPVVPRQDVLPDLLRQGQDTRQLLPACPAAGQGRQFRLQQQPGLEEVRQPGPLHREVFQVKASRQTGVLRHEGPPALLGRQDALGRQQPDGLPQGAPADPQLLRQIVLIGQPVPRPPAPAVDDPGIEAVRRLLGKIPFLHARRAPFPSFCSIIRSSRKKGKLFPDFWREGQISP